MKNDLPRLAPAIVRELGEATERREQERAKETVDLSEGRYRALFENAPVGIVIMRHGYIVLANQSCIQMFGYGHEAEVCNKPWTDNVAPGRRLEIEEAKRQFEVGAVVPRLYETLGLKSDGSVFPINVELARLDLHDGPAIVAFVNDITDVKRAEEKLLQSYRELASSFDRTVKALASITEMRDPYTAGHQVRVSELACAIASGMGFSEDRIKTLGMAASIHDIGKTTIPAEILNKPGALSGIEMALVKSHAGSGYEILKNFDFGDPIADIIWQHHERLNGSGYPRGLSGDEISLDARILSVADVVEAMSSHRPYHPARLLQQALEEIRQQKGILYEETVVDTCLNLIENGEFSFH
jgi:PAS domain S-box-containing protein/putative nucleotidyltransferase with HDIG domain